MPRPDAHRPAQPPSERSPAQLSTSNRPCRAVPIEASPAARALGADPQGREQAGSGVLAAGPVPAVQLRVSVLGALADQPLLRRNERRFLAGP
jgi:hypothetical protein